MENDPHPVKTRGELIQLILSLASEVKKSPDKWENNDLSSYLKAMASWMEDMDGFYENLNKPSPDNASWSIFADILMAARIYE